MSMPADFVSLILASSDVAGLIGDRVYPQVVPPQAWDGDSLRPCLVFRTAASFRNKTFCSTDRLIQEAFSVDCYAVTYDEAKQLAEAVITAVVDVHAVSGSTAIDNVFLDNEFDLTDMDPGLYRRNLSFTVWHRST